MDQTPKMEKFIKMVEKGKRTIGTKPIRIQKKRTKAQSIKRESQLKGEFPHSPQDNRYNKMVDSPN